MDSSSITTPGKLSWLFRLLYVGPILLFLAAMAYGILEVHSSTDTWIGLAAGRQVLTADEFPTTDTFSHTFYGKVWYNQNWLTHLCQYWLYSHISPDAVIYGTWTLSASVFFLTLLAAYWRSGSWLGALLAASVVGLGCRDFLSARPATTGFFCIASLWALICALEGQRERCRWWPLFLLLPLLLVWGNAHGSFVFGYGVLGLYVGHWFVVRTIGARHSWAISLVPALLVIAVGGIRYSVVPIGTLVRLEDVLTIGDAGYSKTKLMAVCGVLVAYAACWAFIRGFRPRLAISDRQVAGIAAAVVIALVLTVVFGPFGIENFTHGQKVAGSEVFRQVSEWNPPTAPGRHFPPVWRFWTVLGVSLGVLAVCSLVWLWARSMPQRLSARHRLHTSLFDVGLVVIGLSMTFWARRFAPIYFIFGAPVFLTWIIWLLRPVEGALRALWPPVPQTLRAGVMAGAGLFALFTAQEAWTKARNEIVRQFEYYPQFNLLERVSRYDLTPHNAILFLKNNSLNVNLIVEWTQAGPVMFHAQNAKVFMDGRAQQVYDETHYRKYAWLLSSPDTPREFMMKTLAQHKTDAALLRRSGRAKNLWLALKQSNQWVPVLLDMRYGLFFHRDSRGLAQLGELLRRGKEWRPSTPAAFASRGFVWQAITPPDLERAIECWKVGLNRNVLTGTFSFRPITEALSELGRRAEAQRFVKTYYERLNRPVVGLSDQSRRELLKILSACWNELEAGAPAGQTDNAKE